MKKSATDHPYEESKKTNCVECKNITAWYEDENPILKDISTKIPCGKITLLCGPNGSGKTTLLRILRGIHSSFNLNVSGIIKTSDLNLLETNPELLGEHIGIVFQKPVNQLMGLTVSEEICLGPILFGHIWKDVKKMEEEAAKSISLNAVRNRNVFSISSGQQAKTVIASILALKPSVLILDEPTSYLDPQSREEVIQILRGLIENGITIILSSHRIEEEINYVDNIIVFNEGRIVLQGPPKDLVFSKEWNDIMPSRSYMKVNRLLWERNLIDDKTMHPSEWKLVEKVPTVINSKQDLRKRTILECSNLSVKYPDGTEALHNVSVKIPEKSIVTIVGRNGSGKTTLAKACVNILKSSSGKILINNQNISTIDKTNLVKNIGYVPTDPNDILFSDTVREELLYSLKNFIIPYDEHFIDGLVETFKLEDLLDKFPETLSLGQQKRLVIAAALTLEPKILFLDEPTLALDGESVETLVNQLNSLREKMTVVLLTHDIDVLVPISDYVIVLDKGQVVFEGEPRSTLDTEIEKVMKPPLGWKLWRRFPEIKTWEKLAEKAVKIYENRLD